MMSKLYNDVSGNMATIFAVSLMLIMITLGAAVDISGMSSSRSTLQNYVDSAVLAAAASGVQDLDELQIIVDETVEANNMAGTPLTATIQILDGNYLSVEISAAYQTSIMGMFGVNEIDLVVGAEAPPKSGGKLNLALVLDVTGSMEGSKIDALKTAAANLVTQIETASNGDAMISIVPFAQSVQLPLSHRNASWLEIEPDYVDTWNSLVLEDSVGCVDEGTAEDSDYVCDTYVYIEKSALHIWEGCMGSRADILHETADYNGFRFQGFASYFNCHSPLLPLTNNYVDIAQTINDLDTKDDTNIPTGLIWGWRTLTPGEPFTQANTADYNERSSVMILMSDGENNRAIDTDPSFSNTRGYKHSSRNVDRSNQLTETLCQNIKADGVVIYSIAYEITDPTTLALMRNCASSAGKFFDATNTASLITSFDDIGKKLARVRLSK